MKKLLAVLLGILFVFGTVFACAEPVMGGWSVSENNEITEENRAVFDKATQTLLGVNYEPIALLGTQVVAGTNFCFLCRTTVVYPDAVPQLALVYIYLDLEGNATVTNVSELDIAGFAQGAME